jgi:5-(carboxyamino)imidazole ribonucleotide synthase
MRVGIVGGGQLAKMMAMEGSKLGFSVAVLDPAPDSPAGRIADRRVVGGYYDGAKLKELVDGCDVTTYDIEHIDAAELKKLESAGSVIHPSPAILEVIQDKLLQKEILARAGLPVPPFRRMDAPDLQLMHDFGFPLVQKARRGGYDGRGVFVLRGEGQAGEAFAGESMVESLVDIDKELAVMVACGADGEVRSYPVVEMVFDSESNLLDLLVAPARITAEQAERARDLAVRTAKAFGGLRGVLGVEMFLTRSGEILINEVAPRPHNSGHYTIEACVTSQYEQHLRGVGGLPLGSTELLVPAVMINLLGAEGAFGEPCVLGLKEAMAIEGATIHIYGKEEVRPKRKMGHAVIVDHDIDRALEKAEKLKAVLKISGRKKG